MHKRIAIIYDEDFPRMSTVKLDGETIECRNIEIRIGATKLDNELVLTIPLERVKFELKKPL